MNGAVDIAQIGASFDELLSYTNASNKAAEFRDAVIRGAELLRRSLNSLTGSEDALSVAIRNNPRTRGNPRVLIARDIRNKLGGHPDELNDPAGLSEITKADAVAAVQGFRHGFDLAFQPEVLKPRSTHLARREYAPASTFDDVASGFLVTALISLFTPASPEQRKKRKRREYVQGYAESRGLTLNEVLEVVIAQKGHVGDLTTEDVDHAFERVGNLAQKRQAETQRAERESQRQKEIGERIDLAGKMVLGVLGICAVIYFFPTCSSLMLATSADGGSTEHASMWGGECEFVHCVEAHDENPNEACKSGDWRTMRMVNTCKFAVRIELCFARQSNGTDCSSMSLEPGGAATRWSCDTCGKAAFAAIPQDVPATCAVKAATAARVIACP